MYADHRARTKDGLAHASLQHLIPKQLGICIQQLRYPKQAASYSLGRAWGGSPRLAYINTSVNDTKVISTRFTAAGMNVPAYSFKEYNTHKGTVVTTHRATR
jgi:hypothetical protein